MAKSKNRAIFAATLKNKGDDSEEDYESAEEDFPAVGLEELLDGLKLDDGPKIEGFSDGDNSEDDIGGGYVYKGSM